jgi:hypothetical protein
MTWLPPQVPPRYLPSRVRISRCEFWGTRSAHHLCAVFPSVGSESLGPASLKGRGDLGRRPGGMDH